MAVPVLKVSEFNKICRVCLMVKKEMRPLFGDLIPTMMETCTTVKISREDSLPKFLCMQCVHQLSRAFTFKSLVEKSDSILRKFLTSCPTLDIMPNNSTEIVHTDGSAEIITDDVTEPDQSSMQIFDVEEKKDNITYHVMEGEENGNDAEEIKEKELQPEKEDESDEDTFLELATFQASQSMVPGRCICNLCHKEFKNTKWLKGHMALHSNWIKANCKKMLKCKLCQRAFKGPGMLKMHMRTHEEKMQVVPTCTVCGRTFSSKAMLYRHRQTHFEKKTYPCGICSKTFVSNYALQSHIARHRGERRFSCISCGKSFYNSTDLKVHMRLHTGEKPLKCGDCGKAFRRHSTLCQHVKKHRGIRTHTCEICNRAFFELSKLAAHRRVHTGEKPFECEVCTRRFAQQSALVYHKRTHTGERPYSCTVCHMRFTTSSARNSHMMMHGSDSRKSSVSDGPEPVKRPRILKEKTSRTNTADAEISEDHVIQLPNNLEVPANSIYICATCNKSYTEVNQWKKHMKKHEMPSKQDEEDKPEVKIQSNSNVSMQVEVQANSAVSTNEDLLVERSKLRYACHMCKKHYAHVTTLEKHIKTHHNLLLITEDTAANYQQQVKLQQQHQDHHHQQQQQQQQQHQQHHQQQQMQQIQVTQLNQQTQPHLQLQHGTILQPQIHVQQLQQPHQQIVQQHPQQIAVSTVQTLQVQQQQQQHQTVAVQAQQLLQPVQVQAIQLAGQPSHHHHHHHQHPLQLAVQQQMHVAQTNCHLPSIVQVPASVVNSLQQQELTAIGSNITHRIILQPQHHVAQPHTTTVYLHH